MLPAGYNNTHRIVQTPDHVVLQHEMIHDVRIIPLSDYTHIDDRIGLWMGDARAHWDGEVLVVETQNFHNRGWIATSGAGGRFEGHPGEHEAARGREVRACVRDHDHVDGHRR